MSKNWFFKDKLECNIVELDKKRKLDFILGVVYCVIAVFTETVSLLLAMGAYYHLSTIGLILSGIFLFIGFDSLNSKNNVDLWIFLKKKLGE